MKPIFMIILLFVQGKMLLIYVMYFSSHTSQMNSGQILCILIYFLCILSQHSGETALMHRLPKTLTGHSHDNCHNHMLIQMSLVVRKPVFCICENKDADQLRGNREADQRLCFRSTDSTIPLLAKSQFSSL